MNAFNKIKSSKKNLNTQMKKTIVPEVTVVIVVTVIMYKNSKYNCRSSS
ncbi:hypothetical protein rpr22_0206 [Rickettsia prowazekii str. Rp22]|uniref:Uncharacterized protein n=1 Tax=Rickettsia prowazekii (strain Rp22) TaxID=449216 RepID=D5AWB7_RICPP|nr:hypothetical protein rpr22_0206 [Rickettsia prowazekii str. Rp22]